MELSAPLRISPLHAFVRLSRPLFLYGGVAGVALGSAVASASGRRLDVTAYLWTQLMVSAFHLMVHYANDYFDRESDVGERTRWSGGSGVLVDGLLAPSVALSAALVCAIIGLIATARFALAGNTATALTGIAILVFAWLYSAPPVRLVARGLGELDTAFVVAVLIPFAGYTAFTGTIDATIATAVVAPAFAMMAMMLCVELPDAGCDARSGKRNLVVRLGVLRAWHLITSSSVLAIVAAALIAYRAGVVAMIALAPATIAAIVLDAFVQRERGPRATAFWGVAFYATLVTGVAITYAVTPAR